MTDSEPVQTEHDPSVADVTLLEDKFPEWFQLRASTTGFVFVLSLTFVFFNLLPLSHTDLWGHLSYGRQIVSERAIPQTVPLMPLSEGVPFIDGAWLTQVLGYGAWTVGGRAAMAFLFALSVTLSSGFIMMRVRQKTGSGLFALLAFGLLLWVDWKQLMIVRPQVAGLVMFCGLFSFLTSKKWHGSLWVGVPVLFALWANMHGSFMVGLGLLGAFTIGRAVDLLRRTGKVKMLLRDRWVFRYLLLTELAAVATLVNPYGLALHAEVLSFGQNANLADIIEWKPLSIRMFQGQAAAAVALMLIVFYRFSPRRVSTTELILLAGLGVGALWTSRMILWWAPVAAYFVALHGHSIYRRWRQAEPATEPPRTASLWTVVSLGIAFLAFEISHMGNVTVDLATGKTEKARDRMNKVAVSDMTPVLVVDKYLNKVYGGKNPPTGLVFNTYEMGDYLTFAGPRNMKLFLNSHAHLVPTDVWKAYMGISEFGRDWESELARYGVNMVIMDNITRKSSQTFFYESGKWNLDYQDATVTVYVRKIPI
ncbi:MAG: hypothetical protein O3C17_02245 [Planctomycetota bacterium]|nr:hypothetical protein [Planctomycetota bacterium]